MKHIVIGQMKRDGKLLKIGSQVELDDAEGERLARGGFTVPTRVDVPGAADAKTDDAKTDDGKKGAK